MSMSKHISKVKKKKIVKMYLQGESPKSLCEYYSIPKSTLYTWIYQFPEKRRNGKHLAPSTEYKNLVKHAAKLEHERDILQSFIAGLNLSQKAKYGFMDEIYGQYNIHEICDAMQVSRGTYYNHLKAKDRLTKYDERKAYLSEQIRSIYEESHKTYGAERIRLALKKQGIKVSKAYVLDLMHENGILSYNNSPKKLQRILMWRTRKEDLFLKGYTATKPNQIWVSDITLFRMNSRDYYICAYMDAYSRRIVSYTIGRSASTHLVKMALIRAYSIRKPKKGLIIHTDGGAQYDSWSMRREYLKRHIQHSISRPGTPTDNKGVVTYKGIEYKGAHEALIDTETWDKVQSILASRVNGERNLKHPHFLKGSVYCAYCGERLIVSNEKKKDGTVYPYFVCNGRHSKRRRDCKTKAVLIDVVEKEIEKIYDSYQLPTKVRILIETYLQKVIADEKRKYESELDGLKGQKAALENKRKKLLEAHYSDAIPLDLMKTEQQKIAKELAAIDHEIDLHNITFEQISANLDMVLDIVENCGEAYRNASDTIKKLMNQAIFEKFYISNGPEDEFGVKLTFKAPYDQILDPIKEDLSQINTALKRKPEAVDGLADKAKGHIHDFFGCGPNLGQNKNPYSNEPDFFNPNSSSKDLLVEAAGVEPASESTLTGLSPGAVKI